MLQSQVGILFSNARRVLSATAVILGAFAATVSAYAEDTIKIAYTDPMSGPFGQVGQKNLVQLQYMVDDINANGRTLGKRFELVVFDNKSQPSEELIALKSITDQNIPFVLQIAGSNIAAALIDGVEKHNARNPGQPVLYLNGGALATELTNEKCSFWHFRFDASADQKAMMLARALSPETRKVYLLNQDYLWGQSLKRDTERFLAKFRPDVGIVGNELIPLGRVQDFSSYISKIKASGAQALITGNWGPDLALLIKAGMDAGLDAGYYTNAAHVGAAPAAIGPGGEGRVFSLMGFNENVVAEYGDPGLKEWVARFRATHNFDFDIGYSRIIFEYLRASIQKAGTVDPEKVAAAMEGMALPDMLGHETLMRAEDHQLFLPYYVSVFAKDVRYDSQGSGLGWKPVRTFEGRDLVLPTSCNMKRPAM